MTGRERLIIGTRWMMENVKQENINMNLYRCHTSGCWLGWMASCPQLIAEGLRWYETEDGLTKFKVNGKSCRGNSPEICEFFNLGWAQASYLFSPGQSGQKADILERLHTVLQQPGPYPEPEIANLDQEWNELQRALEQSHDQTADLY